MSSPSLFIFDNFFEVIARLTSFALTDSEKEKVVKGFKTFHEKLSSISSANLKRLAEQAESKKHQKPTCKHEGCNCLQNSIRGFIRAFIAGLGVKYLIDLIPAIIKLQLFKKPGVLLGLFKKDNIQFATFLSALIGLYKGFLCAIRNFRRAYGLVPKSDESVDTDWLNSFLAALAAGSIAIRLDKNRNRQFTILLYMLTRSVQFNVCFLYNKWYEQRTERLRRSSLLNRTRSEPSLLIKKDSGMSLSKNLQGMKMLGTDSSKKSQNKSSSKDGDVTKDWVYYFDKFVRKLAPVAVASVGACIVVYVFCTEYQISPVSHLSNIFLHNIFFYNAYLLINLGTHFSFV
ncbi:Transmembrane protein 135 [Smittium mucronatum]|uniref:Transmembrane protein 135 n=1 Tax=Smittium mucronatum TaxID=133383 RepID=A0A1R0GXE2_9FUNG|nr:Transmembrane protein 135 [Smittium mucronatum]